MLEVLVEEDEFVIDELISSLVYLRSEFRNTSFTVNNYWLGIQQLTNSPLIYF